MEKYQHTYERYRVAAAEYKGVRENSRARALEAQSLQGALEEIDSVNPQTGEDEALKNESIKLMNVEALRTATGVAAATLSGSEYTEGTEANVLSLLDVAHTSLLGQADADSDIEDLAQRVNRL